MSPVPTGRASWWVLVRTAVIDRLVALLLAPILGPVVAVLAWKVRRDDGSPSLIGLDRVGRGGGTFAMWKVRSMRTSEHRGHAGGAVITSSDDDRITRVGATLRRWRLDELPQVWNVLRGDMGLLGPRPETPSLVDLADPRWVEVLAVRPGITGPTQLVIEQWEAAALTSGGQERHYTEHILPVKLAIDAWYVQHATPATDLLVVWSMVQRFVLGQAETSIERVVRSEVAKAAAVPMAGALRG